MGQKPRASSFPKADATRFYVWPGLKAVWWTYDPCLPRLVGRARSPEPAQAAAMELGNKGVMRGVADGLHAGGERSSYVVLAVVDKEDRPWRRIEPFG